MFRTAHLIVGGPKAERKSLRRNESSKSGSASDADEAHEDTITNGSKKANGGGGGQILFSTFGSNLQKEKEKSDISDTSPSDSDFGELLEIEPEVDIQEDDSNIVVTNGDDKEAGEAKPESWWEPDPESGKFTETGPHLRGFRMKKMRIKIEDKHLLANYVSSGNGNIKCFVKMRNVWKQMKMMDMPMTASVTVETRTPQSHPLICPFADPITNEPCTVAFKQSEVKYFNEHVIQGQCPFSQQSQMTNFIENREFKCEKCGDIVAEHELQNHMEEKHLKITCPACKSKHEARMDVEDHIINEHATHFISMLATVYRKAQNKPPPDPEPEMDYGQEHARSEYQTLEDLIREKAEQDAEEAKEAEERDKMFKEQAKYLAGLKGMNKKQSAANMIMNKIFANQQQNNIAPKTGPKFAIPRMSSPHFNQGRYLFS